MVAGLAARFDVAHLLALEKFDQLRDGLVNPETFLARMHGRDIRAAQPVRGVGVRVRRGVLVLRRMSLRWPLWLMWLLMLVRLLFARVVAAGGRALRRVVLSDVGFDLRESLTDLGDRGTQCGQFVSDARA
ncbi:MAG: hypothetical protein QOG71_317 [Pyrinomonadaceae bacterium]|nr:hypothetical protein [Pyrinomonadaceae bacterium]